MDAALPAIVFVGNPYVRLAASGFSTNPSQSPSLTAFIIPHCYSLNLKG